MDEASKLKAPFPWFGNKKSVAEVVWSRFGTVRRYVEPFFGSGAVLLGRPKKYDRLQPQMDETINDFDGMVANFWRAVKYKPSETAEHASNPVNEHDLHARHLFLLGKRNDLTNNLVANPTYCDPQTAGWWVWGASSWIGTGWCTGDGAWSIEQGKFVQSKTTKEGTRAVGVARQIPRLGGVAGVNNKQDHPDQPREDFIKSIMFPLRKRLQNVRVACGDWSRIMGNSVLDGPGFTGIFLDPPYSEEMCRMKYASTVEGVSSKVRRWCLENGKNPKFRIALCGYEGEHDILERHGWEVFSWETSGGYGVQGGEEGHGLRNSKKERIWFSPACLTKLREK